MNDSVLISGGSGFIGNRLTALLKENGYEVFILSRQINKAGTNYRYWDPARNFMDPEAIKNIGYIIHLAGANIGESRWTAERRKEISDSRVMSGRILYNEVMKSGNRLKAFISASGVNYYGTVTVPRIFFESDPPARDFLGQVCSQWEKTANDFSSAGIRSVVIRSGIALSMDGGVLPRMAGLASKGLAAALGSGGQYIPWIHLEDLCRIYLTSITDSSMQGPYNAVSPEHTTNKNFMATLSDVYQKPFILPAVPAFGLRLAYGEMASLVLEGSRVSAEKIMKAGFNFRFPTLSAALRDLCIS